MSAVMETLGVVEGGSQLPGRAGNHHRALVLDAAFRPINVINRAKAIKMDMAGRVSAASAAPAAAAPAATAAPAAPVATATVMQLLLLLLLLLLLRRRQQLLLLLLLCVS